jgi:O-antigen ligase
MQAPLSRISSIILFVTVAAAPLPFGSASSPVIAFWCFVLGVCAVFVSTRGLRRQHLPLLTLAIVVILGYAFVLHEQLAAHPWMAPFQPLWREASEALGSPIAPSASIVHNQPFFALGAPLANILALFCGFFVCIDRHRARQLIVAIAWSGVAYAIYGIGAYLFDPGHILWADKTAYLGVLTSTFINRNTAAVYFGSCAVLWLLLLTQNMRRRLPPGPIHWRTLPRRLLAERSNVDVLSFGMLLLMLTAMLLTNSRAGTVFSLIALVVAFVAFVHRDVPRRGGIIIVIAIGALSVLIFLQVLGGNVSGRFEAQGLADEGRLETYRSTLHIVADHPWFGTGLGTFNWAFPAYRSAHESIRGTWDLAHSTPLELASDLGLPLAGLIAFAWLVMLGFLIRGILIRQRDLIVPSAAFAVAILALAHSTIDFSLQISGYSIIVFALVGAGLAQSFSSSRQDRAPPRTDKILDKSP